MSVINPNESSRMWQADGGAAAIQLFLTEIDGEAGALVDRQVAGFPVALNVVSGSDWIDGGSLAGIPAAVIQVDADNPSSTKRFHQLAASVDTPLIAASYDPPLALVRSLVRAGAVDVIPLPLTIDELESALEPIRADFDQRRGTAPAATGKLATVIKSVGGVGATALLTQLAVRMASRGLIDRGVCVIDLDVQFGDVAFQLGMQSKLTLADLLEAGNRLDADLLRAATATHRSGLHVLSAPHDMMPIEGLPSEQLLRVVDLATRAFGAVFVDLPTNWSNWSLSLSARSDLVFLITELSIASLSRARRQLDLLRSQDLGNVDVRVVVNRFEKSQMRKIGAAQAREALGRDISYHIANDFALMSSAIDRGVPIDDLQRKSTLAKDLDVVIDDIAPSLGEGI